MYMFTDVYKGKRLVPRRCPNAGHPCNCIGKCQPIIVDETDQRLDEEIIAEYDRVEKQYKDFRGIDNES